MQSRRTLRVLVLAVVLSVGLAGCQRGIKVMVLNNCDQTVEVWIEDANIDPAESAVDWAEEEPEQWADHGHAAESAQTLYVRVRADEHADELMFDLAVSELPEPPEGVEGDVAIVLEDDRCPVG